MSIEQILVTRARSYTYGTRAKELINYEASKGNSPILLPHPVSLEPRHLTPNLWNTDHHSPQSDYIINKNVCSEDMIRVSCQISTEYTLEWYRAERFLKQLCGVSHRVGFEIYGNSSKIKLGFLLHKSDQNIYKIAFDGELSGCTSFLDIDCFNYKNNLFFFDFFPNVPYHKLQTQPSELHVSLYESFIRAIAALPDNTQGFIQVLFQPAKYNWHQNIEFLSNIEFMSKSIPDPYAPFRALQLPSSELKNMARKSEMKAHDDKPFYFVAIRAGINTTDPNFDALPFASFAGLIYRGGQPLHYIKEQDYLEIFNHTMISDMFNKGLTYRPGFLLNSSELASFVHLPSIREFAEDQLPIEKLEILRIPQNHQHLISGIEIGTGNFEGEEIPVCINDTTRRTSTHIIGRPGTGKTTTLEHMILQDIEYGHGLAYIDPHGDSVKRLLHFIPESRVESTIYIEFGNSDWVPLWNPLKQTQFQNSGRTADELVAAIKSIVKSNAWGDRLEHILRNAFLGLLHLDDATFFDLLILFEQSQKDDYGEKDKLQKRIIDALDNEVARIYWKRDYPRYRRDDFAPPLHKLSKLLTSDESVSLMLTQPENRIDFTEIMDSKKILLLDLSGLGPDTRRILGCFLLSFLYNTALLRNKINPNQRKTFSIYCDEAHKLTTDTLEDMLAESRKFGVNLTLAHQFLNQFKQSQRDALSSVGTTIIFNIDTNDARFFVKDLQDKVETKDIITLKTGEAIAKINSDIIKIRTPAPKPFPTIDFKKDIVKMTHNKYCHRAAELKEFSQKNKGSKKRAFNFYEEIPIENEDTRLNYDEFE